MVQDGKRWADVARGVLRGDDVPSNPGLRRFLDKRPDRNLHYIGNLGLLRLPGIGFCGSRDVNDKGIATARNIAASASSSGYTVVSGYARGVDTEAHKAALNSAGQTIIVLPEGIDHFRIKTSFREVWDWGRILVISQFLPCESWTAGRAMQRNSLILALSDSLVVIEARENGGTFAAGKEALRIAVPLFVAEYEENDSASAGNRLLVELGGHPIRRSKTTMSAKLDELFKTASKSVNRIRSTAIKELPAQRELFAV
jgi:DNA processing protein